MPNDWDGRRHVAPTCWHAARLASSPAGLGAGARPCRDRAADWGGPMDRDSGPAQRGDDTRPDFITLRDQSSARWRAGSADMRGRSRLSAGRRRRPRTGHSGAPRWPAGRPGGRGFTVPRVPFLNEDPPPGSGEIVSKRPVSVNDQGLQAPQTCKPWVHVRRLATGALRIFAGPGGPG